MKIYLFLIALNLSSALGSYVAKNYHAAWFSLCVAAFVGGIAFVEHMQEREK